MKKFLLLALTLFFAVSSIALAADEEGTRILQKMDQVMKSESKILEEEMILITANGQERMRKVKVWNSNGNGEEKMLLRFLEPESVSGTGFMMVNDDMWLYLPALGKVQRIAGHAKKGNFMGSDLSYEDMQSIGNKGFSSTYTVKQHEKTSVNNKSAFKLELLPKNNETSYSSLFLWLDDSTYLPIKIQYYDEKGNLVKTLTTSDHRKVGDRWTAMQIQVKDERKGSQTILKVTNVQFNVKLDADLFTTRNLERGK